MVSGVRFQVSANKRQCEESDNHCVIVFAILTPDTRNLFLMTAKIGRNFIVHLTQ